MRARRPLTGLLSASLIVCLAACAVAACGSSQPVSVYVCTPGPCYAFAQWAQQPAIPGVRTYLVPDYEPVVSISAGDGYFRDILSLDNDHAGGIWDEILVFVDYRPNQAPEIAWGHVTGSGLTIFHALGQLENDSQALGLSIERDSPTSYQVEVDTAAPQAQLIGEVANDTATYDSVHVGQQLSGSHGACQGETLFDGTYLEQPDGSWRLAGAHPATYQDRPPSVQVKPPGAGRLALYGPTVVESVGPSCSSITNPGLPSA